MPSEPAARQALDAALATWQQGQPPGAVPDQSPNVQFVDSNRRAGQKLVGYEILGEVASEGRRTFLVQLRLENPSEAPKVRFCVLGVEPLWVFREEELDMIAHWACGAPEDSDPKDTASKDTASKDTAPEDATRRGEEKKK